MDFLDKKKQITLFRDIKETELFDYFVGRGVLLDFLNSIWPLNAMPSTDPRFKTLHGDITQHCINNNDWEWDFLFAEILHLFEDNQKFKLFVDKITATKYFGDKDTILKIVDIVNEHLLPQGFELAFTGEDKNGLPIYSITNNDSLVDDSQIKRNTTPFIVIKKPLGYSHKWASHTPPLSFPSFVLVADGWDDFGVRSQFDLFYYPSNNDESWEHIGQVKMIHKTEKNNDEMLDQIYSSREYLPDKFELLSEDYCSLGQSKQYYETIKKSFPDSYRSVLWALKDCAIYPRIEELFDRHQQFYSLIRDNSAERILREEKYLIEGRRLTNRYQFNYQFTPKYSDESISIQFKFEPEKFFSRRTFAIIGKNGVGKTQMITSLPLHLSKKQKESFTPQIPIYSKVIAVSNSYYDSFKIPKSTASFNYIYCGLSKMEQGEKNIIPPRDLKLGLIKSCKIINAKGRGDAIRKILSNILDVNFIEEMFIEQETDKIAKININNLSGICEKISSGESTLLYLFCNIISNIRYDSLLLFDEPETHLHPNAITSLMSAIYDLLEEYQSYAIIVTHSPLIIREMTSDCVYVMDRMGTMPAVRKIGLESFGANLTTLVEEVFSNKDIPNYYKKKTKELVSEGLDFEQIVQELQSDQIPLGLNVILYIKSLY